MYKFSTLRLTRAAIGLAAASALALAPMAAQADTTNATGTLTAGSLSELAPTITAFTGTLSGVNQTVHAAVGAWYVHDAVGDAAAYHATAHPTTPVLTAGPVAVATPVALGATAASIDSAAAATGAGQWDFAADGGATKSLAITIPGDAVPGAYVDTLTYTIAAGA